MMKKYLYLVLFFPLIISGCKSLNTNIEIRKQKIPDKYETLSDTNNIASTSWRNVFNDSLLVQLIDSAIVNNIDMQIALQKIEMSRSDVKLSNGELLPKVSIGLNAGVRKYGLYTMDGAGNISTEITPGQIVPTHLPDYYVGLMMSWEIDIWGKLRNQKKAATARYLSSIEGTKYVMTQLVSEIASNYYELLALENELEVLKNNIEIQKNAVEMIIVQKEAGVANELAVQQFQAQLINTQTLELDIIQMIFEIENKLKFLCGRFYQPIERNKEMLLNDIPENIGIGLPSDLISNRTDIKEAEYLVMATKYDLKAAKAAFFPNINLSASFGVQAFNPEFIFNPASIAYSALGGIVSPLLNFNALKAQFNYRKANQTEALYNYQKKIIEAYVEVTNEINQLNTLQNQVQLKTQEVSILQNSVQTSIDLFTTGKATYIEVIMAQQNTLEAQLQLIEVKQKQHTSVIDLYRALGGGWN